MFGFLSKGLAFFWRKADLEEPLAARGGKEIKRVEGVVTRYCQDFGMIDDLICFTSDAVMGNALLQVGQRVIALVEEGKTTNGLKAIRVDVVSDKWECGSSMPHLDVDLESKTLIGTITSATACGGFINQTTSFSKKEVLENNYFEPYKGDWVQAEYVINPRTLKSEAVSVKPLRTSSDNGVNLSEPYENLLKDKGGLCVSKPTDFGILLLGEKKSMEVWIE
uniref:Uncharacterized protein n=1 Tax=Sphaerodactylus townsendi TaxID=933632 RepID=A0ACB8FQC0_9SAUR